MDTVVDEEKETDLDDDEHVPFPSHGGGGEGGGGSFNPATRTTGGLRKRFSISKLPDSYHHLKNSHVGMSDFEKRIYMDFEADAIAGKRIDLFTKAQKAALLREAKVRARACVFFFFSSLFFSLLLS